MCVYLCTKFQVSSITLTSFRRGREGGILTPPQLKTDRKKPTQVRVKVVENFNTTLGYYLSNVLYPYFISCQCFLFIPEYRRENRPEIDSGTSLFLVKALKKIIYTWRMTNKFS